jgi:hypothetical protein
MKASPSRWFGSRHGPGEGWVTLSKKRARGTGQSGTADFDRSNEQGGKKEKGVSGCNRQDLHHASKFLRLRWDPKLGWRGAILLNSKAPRLPPPHRSPGKAFQCDCSEWVFCCLSIAHHAGPASDGPRGRKARGFPPHQRVEADRAVVHVVRSAALGDSRSAGHRRGHGIFSWQRPAHRHTRRHDPVQTRHRPAGH